MECKHPTACHGDSIPEDVWAYHILPYLSISGIRTSRLVSKSFEKIFQSELFWNYLGVSIYNIKLPQKVSYLEYMPYAFVGSLSIQSTEKKDSLLQNWQVFCYKNHSVPITIRNENSQKVKNYDLFPHKLSLKYLIGKKEGDKITFIYNNRLLALTCLQHESDIQKKHGKIKKLNFQKARNLYIIESTVLCVICGPQSLPDIDMSFNDSFANLDKI